MLCKEAIEQAVRDNYRDNRLDADAVWRDVTAQFGAERAAFVRYDRARRKTTTGAFRDLSLGQVPASRPTRSAGACFLQLCGGQGPPVLTDALVTHARRELEAPKKPSVMNKLQNAETPLKSAASRSTGACEMETGRKRNRRIRFWVNDAELAAIRQKMAVAGTINMAAYLRKMAIDGRIIFARHARNKTLVSLLRRTSANVNQIAKQANASGRVYENDLAEIQHRLGDVWLAVNAELRKLAALEVSCTFSAVTVFFSSCSLFSHTAL